MPRGTRLIPERGALHVMCRGNNKGKFSGTKRSIDFITIV